MTIYLTELTDDKAFFPNISEALTEPDGLLAMGGDLTPERLINAYKNGIFPWFSDDQPILWWSPSKRAIIQPADCHISKSMKRVLRNGNFRVTLNRAFTDVICNCAAPRSSQPGTWITEEMIAAYIQLHQQGIAHSVEVWQDQQLVGGLYGVNIGTLFCGESMFSKVSNSSKVAFIALNQHLNGFANALIDCQMQTAHLSSLGVQEVAREQFLGHLQKARQHPLSKQSWSQQDIVIEIN